MHAGLPRLGGGVSSGGELDLRFLPSSPPRRGCFFSQAGCCSLRVVFPASAGVFLVVYLPWMNWSGLPRLGGGVSITVEDAPKKGLSSPPRRGCFSTQRLSEKKRKVFPASAGVFPPISRFHNAIPCLPRLGGGVSVLLIL